MKLEYKWMKWISFILIPLATFLLWMPFKILNPTYLTWLYPAGDIGAHFVGWHLFRMSSWNFPLAWSDFGFYPMGYSILMTDSNPLICFLLKPFSFLLPDDFQFIGPWYLVVTTLTYIFSYKIVGRLGYKGVSQILSGWLLALLPALFYRAGHPALTSIFYIYFCFYICLLPMNKLRFFQMTLVTSLSLLTHPYLFLICFTMLVFYHLYHLDKKKILSWGYRFSVHLLLSMIVFFGCMKILGLFRYNSVSAGFGYFSMNLNALFNPQGASRLFSSLKSMPGQGEGFQYLGLGWLLAIFSGLILQFFRRPIFKFSFKLGVLFLFGIILSMIAISPKVYFGDQLLVHYDLPSQLSVIGNIFRASGRMFWPVSILLLAGALNSLRGLSPRKLIALLTLCLSLQIIDVDFRNIHSVNFNKNKKKEEDIVKRDKIFLEVLNKQETKPAFITLSEKSKEADFRLNYSSIVALSKRKIQVNRLRVARLMNPEGRIFIGELKETIEKGGWYLSTDEECKIYDSSYEIIYFDGITSTRCLVISKK